MDFRLTADQAAFADAVQRFAGKELKPGARERAHAKDYPWDIAKKMAAQGLLGITMKEEDGGQGGSLMDAVIAIQTVAASCPRSADVVQAGNFGPIRVLAEYGTPPRLGEHTREVLMQEFGVSATQVDEWMAKGVVA